jgi:uncharacterized protein YacL
MLLVLRLLFLVMLVTVTVLTLAASQPGEFEFGTLAGLLVGATAVGLLVVLLDAMTPNKRLTSVVGVYLGVCVGLIGALAIGALVDVVAQAWELSTPVAKLYLGLGKIVVAITLCYLAVSIILTTKDDFRLVIPYVEFSKQVRGVRPLLLDTSVLIDGRIEHLGATGFLDAPLVVPQFVLDELQRLADSGDKLKRARGRRGLSVVSQLQASPSLDLTIDTIDVPGHSVDHKLLALAAQQHLRILSTDYNLNKVGKIQGVTVLNLNDAGAALKSQALPGETLLVEVVRPGEGAGQGVGYLPDGTMVVIEGAAAHVGEQVHLVATNSLQTTAGRMIFGRLSDGAEAPAPSSVVDQMAQAATTQPRGVVRPPPRRPPADSPRNPRR